MAPPSEAELSQLRALKGLVATVVLSGTVQEDFAACREEMRVWCVRNGFDGIEWKTENAVLVEHGRDACLQHALAPNPATKQPAYDWCLQVDADATFPPDALLRILHTAYVRAPDADVVGAYAQLKHPPFLPTIDTGTGTWEPHFPGEGILPVMRTGAHFLLIKTRVLTRFGPPWFRTRLAFRPVDALREIDNYARMKFDGRNPLAAHEEWETLLMAAKKDAGGVESPVGEDSGFCDAAKAAGAAIYVDCDLVTGHIGRRVISPQMLKEAMDARVNKLKAAVGIVT